MSSLLRPTIVLSVALLSVLEPLQASRQSTVGTNDFAFLEPWFKVEQKDRDTLARRGVVVYGLPASNKQVGVIATCAIDISADALVARVRAIGNVKSAEVVAGPFSEPPALDDLAAIALDQGDIDRLRSCRPGECALNLADSEMGDLQRALTEHPKAPPEFQHAFRRMILARLVRYQSGGLAALPAYHDRRDPVQPAAVFSEILQQIPYLKAHAPAVEKYLARYPLTDKTSATAALHWSKVMMNNKPVVTVTHLTTFRPEPGPRVPTVLVAAKQVYASRYMNGELTLWMLFASGDGSSSYMVYVMRSELDELGGSLSAVKRMAIESRIKAEVAEALVVLRDRLERRP